MTTAAYLNIQLVDYAAALAKLDAAKAALPCVNEPVPAAILADYFLFRGLVLYYQGDADQAEARFGDALAVQPSLRWREDFGQRPRSKFLDAKAKQIEGKPSQLLCPFLIPGASAYIDGSEAPQGDTTPVPVGVHLIQVRRPDGTWWGRFYPVTSSERVDLPVPHDIVQESPRVSSEGAEERPTSETTSPTYGEAPEASQSWTSGRWPIYAAAGVSALSLGSAALFGGRYWSTRTKLFGSDYSSVEESPEKDLLLKQNKRAAIGADVSLAVSIIAAGTAYGLYAMMPSVDASSPSYAIIPFLSRRAGGVQVSVRFR